MDAVLVYETTTTLEKPAINTLTMGNRCWKPNKEFYLNLGLVSLIAILFNISSSIAH